MLNLALIVQPSQAETVSSSEALPAEDTGFADYEYSTLEGSTGTQGKPSGVPPEIFQGREERWDFQNISEWSSFIYTDGNRTRLIVGVRADGTTNLFELERIVTKLVWVMIPETTDLPSDRPAVYVNPQVLVKPLGETFTISVDIFDLVTVASVFGSCG